MTELHTMFTTALTAAEDAARGVTDHDERAAILTTLAETRARLDALIDEVAAGGVLEGQSVRSLAEAAGVAPNTLSPRLARTAALGAYAEDGRVGAEGVARARYDLRNGQYRPAPAAEPLTFRTRRPRKDPS